MNLNFLISLEVAFVIMLTVITWNQDSKKLYQCSRDRSRIVRDVINKKFMPILAQHKIPITKNCPFHPDRDYLWWPFVKKYDNVNDDDEDSKRDSFWICPFCGLDFYCPESLILHWDDEHRDKISHNYRDDLVCLADYCDIFRCDVLIKKRLQQKKQQFMGYLSFSQEDVFKCDSAKMDHLHQSCLNVIRQCTASLEFNASTNNLANIEKELTDSVCSYLTCDHYNDDLFVEDNVVSDNCFTKYSSRKVPIILFSTIGVIMISGFCFCYYLIWTFVERGLIKLNEYSDNNQQANTLISKQSFHKMEKIPEINSPTSYSSGNFFQNIFEFNHDNKEDTFEYKDFNANVPDYESKSHPISSIIEEEEEEKDEAETDISYNSYPIINRKYIKRNYEMVNIPVMNFSRKPMPKSVSNISIDPSSRSSSKSDFRQIQEICLHDLPFKVHPRFIQPVKYSHSDQYPCYSGSLPDTFPALTNKSRSYSHSHLRNAQQNRILLRTKRQDSIEEEWEQKSQKSHSSSSIKTSMSTPKLADSDDRVRATTKSSQSYNTVHPIRREESFNMYSLPSSQANSNASITSRTSGGNRIKVMKR